MHLGRCHQTYLLMRWNEPLLHMNCSCKCGWWRRSLRYFWHPSRCIDHMLCSRAAWMVSCIYTLGHFKMNAKDFKFPPRDNVHDIGYWAESCVEYTNGRSHCCFYFICVASSFTHLVQWNNTVSRTYLMFFSLGLNYFIYFLPEQ